MAAQTKADVRAVVERLCGHAWTKKEAAIDSLWYSIRAGRPAEEAIRGLANATSYGPCAPTERETAEAQSLYEAVEEAA